jgi:hypothetical protein
MGRSWSRDAPLSLLANYRGDLQADAYPGYDPVFVDGAITEVACNVHARRKFVEAADLLKNPGRPHQALAFYKAIFRIERQIMDLSDADRLKDRLEKTVPLPAQFKAWLDQAVHTVLPKDGLGIAVNYALKHWEALTNFTKTGHLGHQTTMPSAACARWPLEEKHFYLWAPNVQVTPQRSTTRWSSPARRTR